jgi:3-oxoacyl-[acyl-carrier protein] reductase
MYQNMLKDKVAVVTGAGRGIGKAIALAYAEAGVAVCCAARTTAEIEQTAAAIQAQGGRALAVTTDVTQPNQVASMVEQTAVEFGGIDLLVVNAGSFGTRQTIAESAPEQWRTPIEVNLFGAYYCVRAAIPYLQAREGAKIIFIGSGARSRGVNGCSAYTCSKAALWGLIQTLAQELLPSGICVNELIPGPVETDLLSQIQAGQGRTPAAKDEWFKAPADVVPLALFLAVQPPLGPTGQSYNLGRRGL